MDVFQEDSNTNSEEPTLTWVGEGKKYKSVEDLDKSYTNADAHIKRLEASLEEARAFIDRQDSADELLARVQRSNEPPQTNRQAETPPASEKFNKEDLIKLVRAVTDEDRQALSINTNLTEVNTRLAEVFGDSDKAKEAVQKRANELGVSVEFLREVAARSPKAFFAQLSLNETKSTPNFMSKSDVNTNAFSDTNSSPRQGTYKYWQGVLAEVGQKKYFAPALARQRQDDAQRLGEEFYA